jgi:outer membrane lipoprotein LolB
MRWQRIFALAGITLVMLLATGCVSVPKPISTADAPAWSGKLSIKIDATNTQPNPQSAQQTSAAFTLTGNSQAGQLDLFTPLGGKAAQVVWGAGFATVSDGKLGRNFPDLATAIVELTGANIPISQLFGWLQGKQDKALEASMGWEADLTRLADGRLVAIRTQPLPRIELRVVLEQSEP